MAAGGLVHPFRCRRVGGMCVKRASHTTALRRAPSFAAIAYLHRPHSRVAAGRRGAQLLAVLPGLWPCALATGQRRAQPVRTQGLRRSSPPSPPLQCLHPILPRPIGELVGFTKLFNVCCALRELRNAGWMSSPPRPPIQDTWTGAPSAAERCFFGLRAFVVCQCCFRSVVHRPMGGWKWRRRWVGVARERDARETGHFAGWPRSSTRAATAPATATAVCACTNPGCLAVAAAAAVVRCCTLTPEATAPVAAVRYRRAGGYQPPRWHQCAPRAPHCRTPARTSRVGGRLRHLSPSPLHTFFTSACVWMAVVAQRGLSDGELRACPCLRQPAVSQSPHPPTLTLASKRYTCCVLLWALCSWARKMAATRKELPFKSQARV